ncbi:hypothetical protein BTJ68_11657 [Hortaea werneckii EXF-2000]|uniref:Uncharacterized protein n=1 Tax=Hortaea werneckii EXF-2000 TaxID=1157616 RepID=A0A1Z5STN4_HORWE|nr:hypothetical protein BTJ68_11657 [Hortaea werneckii EXF-2000]
MERIQTELVSWGPLRSPPLLLELYCRSSRRCYRIFRAQRIYKDSCCTLPRDEQTTRAAKFCVWYWITVNLISMLGCSKIVRWLMNAIKSLGLAPCST